jgi:ribose transport system permease protein
MTDTATAPVTRIEPRRRPRAAFVFEKAGIPLFLLVLILIFSVDSSTGSAFTSLPNIRSVLANQSVTGLIALAMVVPLTAGYFDLSVAAIAGVSNVTIGALISTYGWPVWLSLLVGVLAGVLAGALNGFLVAILRLDAFITTLGTYILWAGLLDVYTGGKTISSGIPLGFSLWGSGTWAGVPRPFWLLIVIGLVLWFFLTQVPFGRRLAAIGSNETAARLAGIRATRSVFITYLVAGFLSGVAGALLTSRNGGADSTSALSYLFPALAAVFLGQTAIDPGHHNVWGTMFGLFLVAVAVDGFTLLGASSSATQVFNGLALIISVAVSTFTTRARERRARAVQLENLRGT